MKESYEKGYEELKILSEIIGRLENTVNSRQNWLVTIITGLLITLINGNISEFIFLLSSCFIIISFFILELSLKLPVSRAIDRSESIQKNLRMNNLYEGPNFDISGQGKKGIDLLKESLSLIKRFRISGIYLILIIFVVVCRLLVILSVVKVHV